MEKPPRTRAQIERLADRFIRARHRAPAITLPQYLEDPDFFDLEHHVYLLEWKERDVHILDHKVHLN